MLKFVNLGHPWWCSRGSRQLPQDPRTATFPHSIKTAGSSFTVWLGRNSFQKSWRIFVFIKLQIFFYICIFLVPPPPHPTLGYIHGICGTNWKQNSDIQSRQGFSHMLALSEGLELSPACGQYTLPSHFKIKTKHWVSVKPDSPGWTRVYQLCVRVQFWATWTHSPMGIYTCTDTQGHLWIRMLIPCRENNKSLEDRCLLSFNSLGWIAPLALPGSCLIAGGSNPISAQSSRQSCTIEQPEVFSAAFVVDFENKQMCIDVKQSKNSVQAYWLFHT